MVFKCKFNFLIFYPVKNIKIYSSQEYITNPSVPSGGYEWIEYVKSLMLWFYSGLRTHIKQMRRDF